MGLLDDAIREHLDLKRSRGADPGEIERLEREALGPVRREPTAHAGDSGPRLTIEHEQATLDRQPGSAIFDGHAEFRDHTDSGADQSPRRGFLRRRLARPAEEHQHDEFAHDESFEYHGDPFPHEAAGQALAAEPPMLDVAATHETAGPPDLAREHPVPARPHFGPIPGAPTSSPAEFYEGEYHDELEQHVGAGAAAPPPAPAAPVVPPPAPSNHNVGAGMELHEPGETREWSVEDAFAEEAEPPQRHAPPADGDVLEETPEFLQDTPEHDRLWFEQRPPRDFDFDG